MIEVTVRTLPGVRGEPATLAAPSGPTPAAYGENVQGERSIPHDERSRCYGSHRAVVIPSSGDIRPADEPGSAITTGHADLPTRYG